MNSKAINFTPSEYCLATYLLIKLRKNLEWDDDINAYREQDDKWKCRLTKNEFDELIAIIGKLKPETVTK